MKKTDLETLTSGSILYYPTIEFQSDTWLKAAICVWEKIYRIVPPHTNRTIQMRLRRQLTLASLNQSNWKKEIS